MVKTGERFRLPTDPNKFSSACFTYGNSHDLQMNGKTALVTGGSAGIGKAIALALAREGVDVAICARRKEPLEAAASQIARETNAKWSPYRLI